ncbi:MAG: glycosyltransferase, partial [Oscillospiraceae bacterium]|nr:glycosyltransferase [Oscillospiraceae bacterium]
MALLSIIVPCYNEEAGVEAFYARTSAVCAALPGVETELLFVDDGSSDGTLSRLKALGERERASPMRINRGWSFPHPPHRCSFPESANPYKCHAG